MAAAPNRLAKERNTQLLGNGEIIIIFKFFQEIRKMKRRNLRWRLNQLHWLNAYAHSSIVGVVLRNRKHRCGCFLRCQGRHTDRKSSRHPRRSHTDRPTDTQANMKSSHQKRRREREAETAAQSEQNFDFNETTRKQPQHIHTRTFTQERGKQEHTVTATSATTTIVQQYYVHQVVLQSFALWVAEKACDSGSQFRSSSSGSLLAACTQLGSQQMCVQWEREWGG